MGPTPTGVTERAQESLAPPGHRSQRVRHAFQVATVVAFAVCAILVIRYGLVHGAPDPAKSGAPLVAIVISLLVGLAGIAALRLRAEMGGTIRLRRLSVTYSIFCLIAITVVWILIMEAEPAQIGFGTPIPDEAAANAYVAETLGESAGGEAERLVIPTGVFVQSVEFNDANNVIVTGYIWQRYADSVPPEIVRGFVLPEAIEEAYQATEAYRTRGATDEVIGWYFKATLRQHFDYRHYPFDRQDVWLRIWPREQTRPVVLVPDFVSYDDWDPEAAPGVEEQFVLDGWQLDYATFGYGLGRYSTTFGLNGRNGRALGAATPELYFSLGLRRHVLDVLTSRLVRILAVTFLLFALVLTSHIQPSRVLLVDVLPLAGALCFILILDHNQLRDSLRPQAIVYLEYAYFILYAGLVLAVLNALLLTSDRFHIRFIEYDTNSLPNLIFWPLVLTAFLLVTLLSFYGP